MKKAATFSLDELVTKLIPLTMKAQKFKYTKSDFVAYCVIEQALKNRGLSKEHDRLLKMYLFR